MLNGRYKLGERELGIECESVYFQKKFDELEESGSIVESTQFEDCLFLGGHFAETQFIDCKFVDCRFKDSDLSVASFRGSRFADSSFDRSKLVGIDWSVLNWSAVILAAPFGFRSCDLSYSTFSGLKLKEMTAQDCKMREVDFTECDLMGSDFSRSDLLGSRFYQTVLEECNFEDAMNYLISPIDNSLKGARFSHPEVMTLLEPFNIKIDGVG